MGTRGTIGFHLNGEDKLMYNHFDSYPECLGKATLNSLQLMLEDRQVLTDKVKALKAVDENIPPTAEEIEKLLPFSDKTVSTGKVTEWYVLLRKTQGDLNKILEAGYFAANNDFILDSLMCEYGYIINLDNNTLEFYTGSNKDASADTGRYPVTKQRVVSSGTAYYSCKLAKVFSFDRVCNDKDNVLLEMEQIAKGEETEEAA